MRIVEAVSNTITRPADTTAYASGDLVANSTTAGSVTPFTIFVPYGRGLILQRAELKRSATSVTNATFRLHIYKDSPTCANGDNGAWSTTRSGYQGFVDIVGTGQAFTDSAVASGIFVNNALTWPLVLYTDKDQKLYCLLEARGAYTPSSAETFIVSLIGQAYV